MKLSFAIEIAAAACLLLAWAGAVAQDKKAGGNALEYETTHTPESAKAVVDKGHLVLPAAVTCGDVYAGPFAQAPVCTGKPVPVVVFLYGSSGLSSKAIPDWQLWLASQGIASLAPDSFALRNRVTYKSPVSKDLYEKVHALRSSEIELALKALKQQPWVDKTRLVLSGISEGGPAVARYRGDEFVARILYSWSCENNYFVEDHRTAIPDSQPVLNVMSSTDLYFSPENSWLGNPQAKGHCGDTLRNHKQSIIVLLPGAPHTLLNLPASQNATLAFLKEALASR